MRHSCRAMKLAQLGMLTAVRVTESCFWNNSIETDKQALKANGCVFYCLFSIEIEQLDVRSRLTFALQGGSVPGPVSLALHMRVSDVSFVPGVARPAHAIQISVSGSGPSLRGVVVRLDSRTRNSCEQKLDEVLGSSQSTICSLHTLLTRRL